MPEVPPVPNAALSPNAGPGSCATVDDVFAPGGALAAQNGRNQVRERFAGSGAGLREQDAALLEGARDGGSHLDLTRTRLEGRQGARQRAVNGEQSVDYSG